MKNEGKKIPPSCCSRGGEDDVAKLPSTSLPQNHSEVTPIRKITRTIRELQTIDVFENRTHDDKGMANVFGEIFHDEIRFNSTAKNWFFYDDAVWTKDIEALFVKNLARLFAEALSAYAEGVSSKDDFAKNIFKKFAKMYGQLRFRNTLVEDARSCDSIRLSQKDFDANDNLLNLRNGTLDLTTFACQKHNPLDLLTKQANVSYDKDADCLEWKKFLQEVFLGDAETIRYIQKLCGYCLTAESSEEKLWILFGETTRNGKSTFIEVIKTMLGDYAKAVQPQTLAQKKNQNSSGANSDIARLAGCRLATVSEPPKNMLFDVALVKSITGGDTITARFLYQENFEFEPKFKCVMNTNYLPKIADMTLFSSGRVVVIPFLRHFSESEQDVHLFERLTYGNSLSGILNWFLEGLRLFREEGLRPTKAIVEATADYQASSDKIKNFKNDCLCEDKTSNLSAADVFQRYGLWCSTNGFESENKQNFLAELRKRGLLSKTGTIFGKTVYNVLVGYHLV